MRGTRLQICNDDNVSVSVLQYKAKGSLLYAPNRGMYSADKKKQINQMNEFLEIADSQGADFVVTPEASVPIEIIEKIIDGKGKRPEEGKLWCLGAEGISRQDYKSLIDKWKEKKDIVFVKPEKIDMAKHINAVFYFFQTADNQLAVVLQAKTGAMRDISYEHEQADLSTGEEIFILDLNGEKEAQNVVATLICADILHVNSADFCRSLHGKSPVVINIQMNSKPFYDKIVDFRKNYFEDNDMRNAQMIVANWGKGTTICMEKENNTSEGYSDSGSAVYFSLGNNHGSNRIKRILENPDFIKSIGENQKMGLEYFLSERYEIWKIQEEIQVLYYEKKIGNSKSFERSTTERQYFPYAVKKYRYNEKNILEEDEKLSCNCDEMREILKNVGKRASNDMKECACQKCESCTRFYTDALISLCLGEEISEEFLIKGRHSYRTVQALYQDSKDKEKKARLKKLVYGLDKISFPERFGEFNDNKNFYFAVDHDTVERGGNNKYNLVLKNEFSGYKRLLVVFLGGDIEIEDVCQQYVKIKNSVHEDRKDDILIYYMDVDGMHIYTEPYEEKSILAHNNGYSADIESFK